MIVLQGAMPDKCKRCKKSGGLEDGLYRIHSEGDFVDFFCDGQSPKTCPIKGEIPDKHGRIIDAGPLGELYDNLEADNGIYMEDAGETLQRILDAPTVLEANNE